ncbi:MAK10-like protein [Tanacetum coccineum]
MERFKNAIFKQREDINDKMAEMYRLLKELTASRTPKKVLFRKEARHPVTKHINSISLIRVEEEKNVKGNKVVDENVMKPDRSDATLPPKEVAKINGTENRTRMSQSEGAYARHNPKEKDTKKEDIGGNFEISCNVGGLKHTDALVDQGFDINVKSLSIYNKLTDETPAETDIRLSLTSHSYIYPLGIAEDVLVEVARYMYLVDFMILDIKEDEKRPFILGTPFLTTSKVVIKFDKGTITLRSVKNKISFHGMLEPLGKNKTSLGEGDGIRPIEEQELQE